jgi:hypothetical protein
MLWGSALAAGAEAFRTYGDRAEAVAAAVAAAGLIADSFARRTGSVNCRDVSKCDFTSKLDLIKFMLKFMLNIDRSCFDLSEAWTPEAIQAAREGLSHPLPYAGTPLSCASEVARKMGASDEEAVMVSGFAGGLGLSGNGCGALAAAVWMKSLAWCREHPGSNPPFFRNPIGSGTLRAFFAATGSEMLCCTITGRRFATLDDHTEFIRNKGCSELIDALARA